MLKNKKVSSSVLFFSVLALSPYAANAVEFKAGETDVKISGYVKLDVIYDLDSNLGDFSIPARVSLDGQDVAEGHSNLHARQSRIRVSTGTPVGDDKLVTAVEWDMFGGDSNSPQPRLRHAYGSWNGVLAGQTWTNFVSEGALGQMRKVNFLPEPGANPARQAQLRYTAGGLSVALEDPLNIGGGLLTPTDLPAKAGIPDFTARYQSNAGNFKYAIAGVLRELGYDNGSIDDSVTGWGTNLEAALLIGNKVTLRGTIKYGEGIGGYISTSPGSNAGAYIDPSDGSIELIEQLGLSTSVAVKVGPGAVNIGYAMASADMDEAVVAGAVLSDRANEKYESTHVNYIWSPGARITYGIEVGHHTREVHSGLDGSATRLQAMVQFGF